MVQPDQFYFLIVKCFKPKVQSTMEDNLVAPVIATTYSNLEGQIDDLSYRLGVAIEQNRQLRYQQQSNSETVRRIEQSLISAKMEIASLRKDLKRETARSAQLEHKLGVRHSSRRQHGGHPLEVKTIIDVTCSYLKVNKDALKVRSRKTDVTNVKFIICYFVALFTDEHYEDAAEVVKGRRDHTFICHNRDQAINYIECDPDFKKMVQDVAIMLGISEDNIF